MKILVFLVLIFAVLNLCYGARSIPPRKVGRTPQFMRKYTRERRIIGGSPADIADFPHMLVLLDLTAGGFICGASVIHRLWALSAAHCLEYEVPASEINLRGGSTNRLIGGYIFFTESYTLHPAYDPHFTLSIFKTTQIFTQYILDFDIAIIRAQASTPLDRLNVAPIPLSPPCIPNTACCQTCIHDTNHVTITGWGYTEMGSTLNLLQVTLPVHDRADCDRIWGWIGPPWVCIENKVGADSCSGDSGSPLVRTVDGQRFQIALVSFGAPNCGDGTMPSVNTRIELPRIRNWITQVSGV